MYINYPQYNIATQLNSTQLYMRVGERIQEEAARLMLRMFVAINGD